MSSNVGKRGRPRKHRELDKLLASCPPVMRRPLYRDRIGVRRGPKGYTIWVKVQLPKGGNWKGKSLKPGHALEVKLGHQASVDWDHAIRVRDDLQGRADKGKPLEDKPIPIFENQARDWLERKHGVARDFGTMRLHVELHLLPTFGLIPINQIEKSDIERWISVKRGEGLSLGYIKRMNNTLKAILYDAVEAKLINSNPAVGITAIRGTVSRQRFLTAEQIVQILVSSEQVEPWLHDAVVWALHSGMRRGEIQKLKWPDILSISGGGKIALLETTKSGKSRSVICTQGMMEVLERQTDRHIEGDDRVFPVSAMTWRRRWEKARKLAGLDDIKFHDLRRTNATQAAASGVDMRTLAARIGHTDLAMLEKHYAMVVGSAEHEAATKIQDTFDRLTANVVPISNKPNR